MDSDQVKQARIRGLTAASRTLSDLVEGDPEAAELLGSTDPLPDRTGYIDLVRAAGRAGLGPLRRHKRMRLLEIAARDLAGEIDLEAAAGALSHLADACVQVTLELLDAPDDLAVIAMGKLGGRELNYVSDIDVIFVAGGDPVATKTVAENLLRSLGDYSPEGQAFYIDTNLRPEGRSGALVRSLESCLEYYARWAEPWEYQALIKARPAAGSHDVGREFVSRTRPLVYPEMVSAERVASIRKMKQRVESHAIRASRKSVVGASDDVKLGAGGIRDIEFCVQLLQLVHGGSDESVQRGGTLDAIRALTDGGYVADEDGAGLAVAYRWLRGVEHRLQLWQERRTHLLPTEDAARDRLARALGFKDSLLASAGQRFGGAHEAVLLDVRHRFERIFYRPMIESLSGGAERRLSAEALGDRLRVLGFRDVERAARNLESLVAGTSRRAKLVRVLTPALLRSLATTPAPDDGLFSFLRLGESLGSTLDALGAMRDNPPGLSFLAQVLGSGKLLGEVLAHVPEELHTIANPRHASVKKDPARLAREAEASLGWRAPEERLDGLRRFKRREMLRVSLFDLSGDLSTEEVGESLGDVADACLQAALESPDFPFAIVGMGKLGGRELNYSSDIDVMFVHDGNPVTAEKVAERLLRAVGEVTPEGQAFKVDAGLRPEGKSGPLTRSFQSYVEYYERWAQPWEHQALIKGRCCAGERALVDKLVQSVEPLVFPESITAEMLSEMRHLKARMEKERVGRGTDPRMHLKMGPGGLADIEFAVQLLQRTHGHDHPELRVPSTLPALEAARSQELISDDDASILKEGYLFLTRVRNRAFFLAGRPIDTYPSKPEETESLGVAVGFTDQPRQEMEETYLRVTRRVRRVAERLIYG
ncbi:MAG: bifunctional [glutamine synthetase] adenylyltransferase/[glutamine synthetase]-adenylyl-L-tyrosine phosphorylase [Actinomycetota bacterium]|nr:bifunctional [glutamine synthetase] adenylyltransferase/[glutamine synthetase]-adenylyl-L-tyrosine phosphorylase [Actinomycetota bacterium]